MTEILTESFCERCGTRYTFESSAPRTSRLARVRTLSRGVRNFVMSDESSFSEAMAEARSEEELVATSHQLDAFHQTFNFCLTCRQYTCGDCWNRPEGRCLTCAPLPGQEDDAPAAIALTESSLLLEPIADGNGHAEVPVDVESWPEMDIPADRLARVFEPAPGPPDVVAAAAVVEMAEAATVADAETGEPAWAEVVEAVPVEAVAEVVGEAEPVEQVEPVEATGEPASVTGVIGMAPGQSLDEAIAAYEAMLATQEQAIVEELPTAEATEAAPEPVSALEPDAAPEPVLAEPEAAPEPVLAEPEAWQVDLVEQPTWPVPPPPPVPVAPTAPVAAPPAATPAQPPAPAPWLTVAPEDAPPPQWPTTPAFPAPAARRDGPATLAGRPLLPQADATALWAASAQAVLGATPGPFGAAPAPLAASAHAPQAQPCVSCGLSLSANARFCRRCGSRQG